MTTERLPINVAEDIAREYDQSQVIVVTFDKATGTTHVVTFGQSLEEGAQAAAGGNWVKRALGWPEALCNAVPKRYADAIDVLRNLVEALPTCDACKSPATRAYKRGEGRWCDECACLRKAGEPVVPPDYPRAKALRAAIALLKKLQAEHALETGAVT